MKIERFICCAVLMLSACTGDFLDIKPNKNQVVPQTSRDLQALLDNTGIMNTATPYLPEIGSADFHVGDGFLNSMSVILRNTYLWEVDIYEGNSAVLDWSQPYQVVFYANTVLEKWGDLPPDANGGDVNAIKGGALFFRAWAFYHLAQQFCKPYDPTTADRDLGIPLRLAADLTEKSVRSTVEETYRQILSDLEQSSVLLPDHVTVKTRPTKQAATALLARTYLLMGNYEAALYNANQCLEGDVGLIDYNDLDADVDYPFLQFNDEVIFHAIMQYNSIFRETNLIVNQGLYNSYEENDLRRSLFFWDIGGHISFRGSYNGSYHLFSGIAADEVYLIKAECEARLGMVEDARNSLRKLLSNRYERGDFSLNDGLSGDGLLDVIVTERRKELLLRGIRWSDLRRLNSDDRYAATLERQVAEKSYKLPPGDSRYVFAIPDLVIDLSGMQQNERD